ncbi:hypothetical protein HDU99_007656 [Rhizoclosmatium hyalinum]|nr:hypothetical protein HDU99_007656 [Rhizoclosmatium hyalinum]
MQHSILCLVLSVAVVVFCQTSTVHVEGGPGGAAMISIDLARRSGTGMVDITLQGGGSGWVGVGVGASMASATVWVAWSDGTGQGTNILTQRDSTMTSMPTVASAQQAKIIAYDSTTTKLSTGVLGLTFQVPESYFSSSGPTPMIWAYSDTPPDSPGDPNSNFYIHTMMAAFNADLKPLGAVVNAAPVATSPAPAKTTSAVNSPSASGKPSASAASNSYCTATNSFCFQATIDSKTGNPIFTMQSSSKGWMSVGVGCTTMACANMYVGYKASNGTAIISQRSATGTSTPSFKSTTDFTLVSTPSSVSILASSVLSVSFMIPKSAVSMTSDMNFIYAFSNTAPTSPDSPTAAITQHGGSDRGTFSMNLATGQSSTITSFDFVFVHTIIMFIAWGVIPFISIFIARYLKSRLGHLWYILHMSLGLTILLLTIIGLVLVELKIVGPLNVRFNSSLHAYCGAALCFGMLPAQIVLGYVSNHLFSPDRPSVPWWDQVHWWLGRFSIVFAWVVMFLGLNLYGSSIVIKALYFVSIALGIGAIVGGHFLFGGAVHHVKGADGFDDEMQRLTKRPSDKGTLGSRKTTGRRGPGDEEFDRKGTLTSSRRGDDAASLKRFGTGGTDRSDKMSRRSDRDSDFRPSNDRRGGGADKRGGGGSPRDEFGSGPRRPEPAGSASGSLGRRGEMKSPVNSRDGPRSGPPAGVRGGRDSPARRDDRGPSPARRDGGRGGDGGRDSPPRGPPRRGNDGGGAVPGRSSSAGGQKKRQDEDRDRNDRRGGGGDRRDDRDDRRGGDRRDVRDDRRGGGRSQSRSRSAGPPPNQNRGQSKSRR